MVQVAHAATRSRNSRLRLFYLRVAARRGKKKAIIALARRILYIIHHLLVNGEDYVEEDFVKLPKLKFKALARVSLEEMASVLRAAGYVVVAPS